MPLRTNPSEVLTDMTCCPQFLMCSLPGSLNPCPFLDLSVSSVDISGNMLLGITFSAAPESTATVTFYRVHWGSSCVPLDQLIQSSRRLLFFVVFCKEVNEMLAFDPLAFPTCFVWVNTSPSSSSASKLASSSGTHAVVLKTKAPRQHHQD